MAALMYNILAIMCKIMLVMCQNLNHIYRYQNAWFFGAKGTRVVGNNRTDIDLKTYVYNQ